MNLKASQLIFYGVVTITLFSYWAGFALLVVNKYFYNDLPGYTIGRICIWELVALIVAALITKRMIYKWGSIEIRKVDEDIKLTMHPNYGIYFVIYFLIATATGIWQFWLFSQQF